MAKIPTSLKNFYRAVRAPWSKSFGLFNTLNTNAYDPYGPDYAAENNFPNKYWNAAGTDTLETLRIGTDDAVRLGGENLAPMHGTINFPLSTSAEIVNQHFFIAPFPMKIKSISCIFAVANGATQTGYVEKLTGTKAPGSGQSIMTNTFNLNATAATVQNGTLPTVNPATISSTSIPPYIVLNTGDRLALKMSTTITSLAGLVISIGFLPGGKGNIAVFNMQANANLSDQAFYIAQRASILTAAYAVVSTLGTNGSAVNVQLTKDVSTNAPGAGTDILTNNTNAGFNLKNTINTVETGTLTATAATLRFAIGDRLSCDFAGTLTAVAGLVIVCVFQPVLARKDVTLCIKPNAGIVDQYFFIADKNYFVEEAVAVWSTAAASGNIQLTIDKTTDAPGAGLDLLSMDTNAGWQADGTANTPEKATWIDTRQNYLMVGDRLSIDCAIGISMAGLVVSVTLRPA